jgi:uncharacterized protein YndB with AHSA1/START domain
MTPMTALTHQLERTISIQATRETVFRYFTDSARWATWWGAGSTIDARTGGKMYIRHPNGVEVSGEVVEILAPEKIVFTYGYASGTPIPPGGSRVTIRLEEEPAGTRVHLVHAFADAASRDPHIQGWRFQLSLFGNVVANELHAGAADLVDAWFAAFAEPDEKQRAESLARIAADGVLFRDRYSLLEGQPDLMAQINAYLRFTPGMRLQRKGGVRHCQGTVLADWVVVGADGSENGSGTSVFLLGPSRRIEAVTSLRNP